MRYLQEWFLDDALIARRDNIARRLCQAQKCLLNPVIRPEHPWEQGEPPRIMAPSVVVDTDASALRMFYRCPSGTDGRWIVCTAESTNGLVWHRPALELHQFGECDKTNILVARAPGVRDVLSFWALKSRNPDEDFPYAALVETRSEDVLRATHVLGSEDAIHWSLTHRHTILQTKNDTHSSMALCPDGLYRAFTRADFVEDGKLLLRAVNAMQSKDMVEWSAPQIIMAAFEEDGGPDVQFYGMSVTRVCGGLCALLSVLTIRERLREGDAVRDVGPMHIELAYSRDGANWQRVCPGEAFIPLGQPGSWDAGMVFHSSGIHEWKDSWVAAYSGARLPHGNDPPVSIGSASVPRGRLVSLAQEHAERAGIVQTVPLQVAGGRILVNAQARPEQLRIGLVDETGRSVPGAEPQKCRLDAEDELRWSCTWAEEDGSRLDTSALNGPVAILLEFNGAVLHGLELVEEPPAGKA